MPVKSLNSLKNFISLFLKIAVCLSITKSSSIKLSASLLNRYVESLILCGQYCHSTFNTSGFVSVVITTSGFLIKRLKVGVSSTVLFHLVNVNCNVPLATVSGGVCISRVQLLVPELIIDMYWPIFPTKLHSTLNSPVIFVVKLFQV